MENKGKSPSGEAERTDSRGDPDGGADKDRTCDLLNAIQALYQLSYDPIRSGTKCKRSQKIVKSIFRANVRNFSNTQTPGLTCGSLG